MSQPALQPTVSSFLGEPSKKRSIDGRWVDAASAETFETIHPTTGAVSARTADADRADVDRAGTRIEQVRMRA
jgi:acyl-CoA reductase-like NAD-dependent aldehyde dehydrogenase